MKVLLFVQSGNARPKCVKSFGGRAHSAMQYFARVRERLGTEGQPQKAWLLECENAEEGRRVIALVRPHDSTSTGADEEHYERVSMPAGRILASGGRNE